MTADRSLYDRRLIEWHLRTGTLTEAQLREYYKKLPDAAEKSQTMQGDPRPVEKAKDD